MDSQDVESAARRYYDAISVPGGSTRSQISRDAFANYGADAPLIMGKLDELMNRAPVLMAVGHRRRGVFNVSSENGGDGIFGFGILTGDILKKKPETKSYQSKQEVDEITSFVLDTTREAQQIAGMLNDIAVRGDKIVDYRSYPVGSGGELNIPPRVAKDESWLTERKKGGTIPGTKLIFPEKGGSQKAERWVIQIYTKQKVGGFKYMQEPAVSFTVREIVYHTPEGSFSTEPSKIKGHPYSMVHQHGKIDNFFKAVRSGDYKFVRAYNYQNQVNLVKRAV
jgi:hypothetical protein